MQSVTRMQTETSLAANEKRGSVLMVTPDVACQQIMIVNLYFVGAPGARSGEWTLVDAGMLNCASRIKAAAAELYGANSRPHSIILTHGHFDHIGAVEQLAREWDVPVYAHPLEMPYLTGRSSYPPPDPSVGGAMARLSWMYPRRPIDISDRAQALPADGTIPGMWGWRWIHTPGHTPGHVSLFRDTDRTLIAGDAFVTTKQESAVAALTQKPQEVHGPPKYFTPDWEAARRSVEALAALQPNVAATGHGLPMRGAEMQRELGELARGFDRLAVPARGRYVGRPATANESGVVSVPPPVSSPMPKVAVGVGLAAIAGALLLARSRRSGDNTRRNTTTRRRRREQTRVRNFSPAVDPTNRRNVL